jgi:hypothetical protein
MYFITSNAWSTFWAIFSQTHLVTLSASCRENELGFNLKLTERPHFGHYVIRLRNTAARVTR